MDISTVIGLIGVGFVGSVMADSVADTVDAMSYIDTMMRKESGFDLEPFRPNILAALGRAAGTTAALTAKTHKVSRIEAMVDPADAGAGPVFGEGTKISRDDWFAARDS